jgi:hypothetical protein
MQTRIHWLPALLIGAVFVTACDRAPTDVPPFDASSLVARSAAEHSVEESLTDFDGVYVAFACSAEGEALEPHEGELVRMHGQLYQKYAVRRDAVGGFHVTFQTMPVGLGGVGETSGEEFRAVERQHATYNQTASGYTGAWRSEQKLTGKESGRVFWLLVTGTYRLSADGGVVVDRERHTVECRPAHGQ